MSSWTTRLLPLSLALGACATGAPAQAPTAGSAPHETTDDWRCGGELMPPTGWQQDTAFVDASAPEARERAAEAAASKLSSKLCGEAVGCPALRARITTWKTGSNSREVCAMAVIKAADLEAYRAEAQSLGKLEADLVAAVEALLPKGTRGKRITIDRLADGGIPGGPRADWLRDRLEQRLAGVATLVASPRGWAGDRVPEGVDLVIRGDLVVRRESQISVVEAHLRTLGGAGAVLGAARVTFPESAAPASGSATAPSAEASPGLSLHADAHPGGSLCAGENTQLWLKSDEDAVVRLFNLYGDGEALLIWPDETNPTGTVKGGVKVPLGGNEGFEVIPAPGAESERFIAIAAPTAAGLGRFASVKGTCRLPAAIAADLHRGRGLPVGAKVATDGYRLVQQGCTWQISAERKQAQARALAGLAECQVR